MPAWIVLAGRIVVGVDGHRADVRSLLSLARATTETAQR